jgi:hypothetical protein
LRISIGFDVLESDASERPMAILSHLTGNVITRPADGLIISRDKPSPHALCPR